MIGWEGSQRDAVAEREDGGPWVRTVQFFVRARGVFVDWMAAAGKAVGLTGFEAAQRAARKCWGYGRRAAPEKAAVNRREKRAAAMLDKDPLSKNKRTAVLRWYGREGSRRGSAMLQEVKRGSETGGSDTATQLVFIPHSPRAPRSATHDHPANAASWRRRDV